MTTSAFTAIALFLAAQVLAWACVALDRLRVDASHRPARHTSQRPQRTRSSASGDVRPQRPIHGARP